MHPDDVVLETGRVRLRPWRTEEAPRLFDILSRTDVGKWLGNEPDVMEAPAEAVERIGRWRDRIEGSHGRLGTWAVEVLGSGVLAGSLHLGELPNGDGEVEIGWHFHPDSHGHGYATEAARGILAKGFTDGLPEIFALTHTTNTPSQNVCTRIGMRDRGVIQDPWYGGLSQLYRLTREEWESSRPVR
ncbi:MAG: GNAT family N-acetyltransferase [Nocardioidaceae bacterium]